MTKVNFDVTRLNIPLAKIIKADIGIKKVILVDRTGLSIVHVSRLSTTPIDSIAAIASAVFLASEHQGESLGFGKPNIVTTEFDNGRILAVSCEKAIIVTITDKSCPIGLARHSMREVVPEVKRLLNLSPIRY
ncbi:MAG: roadblock/LC7 domain-containing protein [Candidatus Hermodarchaeota archaeon]